MDTPTAIRWTKLTNPRHPGRFVRESVIPAGMLVKDAANRLGIGRPALSNFLNGKSSLSADMAVRLEKAFGANRKRLLEMQATYDRQAAASVQERCKALDLLTKRFPEVGWDICIMQVKPGSQIGHNSYWPRWRSDASGAGQVVTRKEAYDFARKALDILIAWSPHDEKTLGDLVECLQGMPEEDEAQVWDIIEGWTNSAGEAAKAALRERIRRYAFTRRGRKRDLGDATRNRAREAYDRL